MGKNKDYYYEFDHLAYLYVSSFVKRWKNKVSKKTKNEKTYVFDIFISQYIIYSSLVNVIKPIQYKTKTDREYCTRQMSDFLLENLDDVDGFLFSLDSNAKALAEVIETHRFSVLSQNGDDPFLIINWKEDDKRIRILSLLETLYFLRCNLFHGAKEFADNQIALLTPAVKALEIITKEIESIFKRLYNNKE